MEERPHPTVPEPADRPAARAERSCFLTINGGSSSLKFALFTAADPPERLLEGRIERIGLPASALTVSEAGGRSESHRFEAPDHIAAARTLIEWLGRKVGLGAIAAIGHRVVHGGGRYVGPERVTHELIEELRRTSPLYPDHLPSQVAIIEAFRQLDPDRPQVACFDTAFHHDLPRVAQIVPIPRRYQAAGVRRYGFHGLSYTYLLGELARVAGPEAARGRVILAHLGSGASLAAVREGRCLDTTMGFTPAAGLVMGTRSGDLDPGLVNYLVRTEGMTPGQFDRLVNHDSGLLGISETSSDIRDLLALRHDDVRATEAIDVFCYQAKKWIGALAAALGGLDTLVFAGGIGENASEVRARICDGLDFLGLALDPARNTAHAAVISAGHSPATVRVIHTDEELTIAQAMSTILRRESD